MLVLSRKSGQRIRIGDSVELTVIEVRGNKVRLGFTAPPDVAIHREEVYKRINGQPAEVLRAALARTSARTPVVPINNDTNEQGNSNAAATG